MICTRPPVTPNMGEIAVQLAAGCFDCGQLKGKRSHV
jgi:hypothetical protein